MATQVTLTIPDSVYRYALQVAAEQQASVETVLTDAIVFGETIVTERIARRKANRWLVEHVGNLLMADQGQLIATGSQPYWRFDVRITARGKKPSDSFATIDVDATTAEVLVNEQTPAILCNAAYEQLKPLESVINFEWDDEGELKPEVGAELQRISAARQAGKRGTPLDCLSTA